MNHQGFGFCEFLSEDDADYACKIMNQIKLYGKPIRVNKASYDTKKPVDVGANLFIGSLDEGVDENALFDTFSTFGSIAEHPKVSFSVLRQSVSSRGRGKWFVRRLEIWDFVDGSGDSSDGDKNETELPRTSDRDSDADGRLPGIQQQDDQRGTDSCRIMISKRPTWLWRI
jgi:RNA recognition motif-containing protein